MAGYSNLYEEVREFFDTPGAVKGVALIVDKEIGKCYDCQRRENLSSLSNCPYYPKSKKKIVQSCLYIVTKCDGYKKGEVSRIKKLGKIGTKIIVHSPR